MNRTALLAGLLAATLPLAALADKPGHAGGKGNGHGKGKHAARVQSDRRAPEMRRDPVVVVRDRAWGSVVVVDRGDPPVRVMAQRACPPGLAKKDPACVPPGQAGKGGIVVGDRIDWDRAHVVTRPGLYGLAVPPPGQRYAVVDGRLVRIDEDSARILSIVRLVDALLD